VAKVATCDESHLGVELEALGDGVATHPLHDLVTLLNLPANTRLAFIVGSASKPSQCARSQFTLCKRVRLSGLHHARLGQLLCPRQLAHCVLEWANPQRAAILVHPLRNGWWIRSKQRRVLLPCSEQQIALTSERPRIRKKLHTK